MTDSTFDEFFDNEFYSAPTSVFNNEDNTKNHLRNVRNSIQIKHSISTKSLKELTTNPQPLTNTTTSTSNKRTSAIKSSPSLKALENILNEKSKQYNASSNNVNAILEEEEEEQEEVEQSEGVYHSQTKLSPPVQFRYDKDVGQSLQSFATATESLDEDEESTLTNQNNNNNNNSTSVNYEKVNGPDSQGIGNNNNYLTNKSNKAASTNSHKHAKSSISTISEGGYSTDETPILAQPLTFQSFTPHSHDSPTVKIVDVNIDDVHEQTNIIGTLDTNSKKSSTTNNNNNNGVINYTTNKFFTTTSSSSTNHQKKEDQYNDNEEEEELIRSGDYLYLFDSHSQFQSHQDEDKDKEEMPQKNSHPLQPPRHIKLPSSSSNKSNSSSSTTIEVPRTTITTTPSAITDTTGQFNNPFYQPTNISNNKPSRISQKSNFSSLSRTQPEPSQPLFLQQPKFQENTSLHSNSNKSDSVHHTNSTKSASTYMSLESNNSSLTNNNSNSAGTRPEIAHKSKSMLMESSTSESKENIPKPKSPLLATPKQPVHATTATPIRTTPSSASITGASSLTSSPKKSPHIRSNSAFSLHFISKDSSSTSGPPVPLKHKRSSTMNDLSKLNHESPQQKQQQRQQSTAASAQSSTITNNTSGSTTSEKKKFSFKSLFKSKSKIHSLNNSSTSLEPKKLTSKSYSTPNIQTLTEQPKHVEPKSLDNHRPQMKTTNSFMNRFMKTKSSENLSKMGALQEQKRPSVEKQQQQHTKKEQQQHVGTNVPSSSSTSTNNNNNNNNNSKSKSLVGKPSGETTNKEHPDVMSRPSLAKPGSINFIREISDNSVLVGKRNIEVHDDDDDSEDNSGDEDDNSFESGEENNYDQLSYSRSVPEDEDFDYYDAKNLKDNPPKKLTSGNQYGEEIALLPPLLDSNQFGSPFKVNYQSSPKTSPMGNSQGKLDDSPLQRRKPSSLIPIQLPQSSSPSRALDHNTTNNNNNQLLGEALFPKSLNAHEVESIVSLERSRSMKSVKSNKRNSFVNYDGSDDNIVHYVGPTSNPNSNNGITRSNSILKNSTSRRSNLNEELNMNSIDANISQYAEELNNTANNLNTSLILDDDLMEFSEFIDVDNLNFVDSPLLPVTTGRSEGQVGLQPPSPLDIDSYDRSQSSPSPQIQQEQQEQFKSPIIVVSDQSDIEETKPITNAPVSIDSRTASSSPLSMEHIESPKTSVDGGEHVHETQKIVVDLTKTDDSNNVTGVSTNTTPEPEEQEDATSDAATEIIRSSPILENAYRTRQSPQIDGENDGGAGATKARPISMSFKGLNAPSFSGKFKNHYLRSTDSHQSFNINFNDDSSSSVGGGFGTSSDDEDYESEDVDNGSTKKDRIIKENGRKVSSLVSPQTSANSGGVVGNHSPLISPSSTQGTTTTTQGKTQSSTNLGKSSVFTPRQLNKKSSVSPPDSHTLPPRKFSHNKIPSISDQSSINSGSPRSFTTLISKKWGNATNKKSPASSPRPAPPPPPPVQIIQKISNGVRFSSRIILYDTYNEEEYDRHPDTATCNQLTPLLAQQIKEELNTFKSEMNIHTESRCYTHFF